MSTGYRHVRLLSSMGEPMDNATLFVHVSVTNKKGGGVSMVVNVLFLYCERLTSSLHSM